MIFYFPTNEQNLAVSEPVRLAQIGHISADPERLKGSKTINDVAAAPLILTEARWSSTDPTRRLLAQLAAKGGEVWGPDH